MNWYKKAQLEQGKIKYNKEDAEVYLLSKNTKIDEGPWRISILSIIGRIPLGHLAFLTYEEALEMFNRAPGVEAGPDLSLRQVFQLS
jgi:hypothetical protein